MDKNERKSTQNIDWPWSWFRFWFLLCAFFEMVFHFSLLLLFIRRSRNEHSNRSSEMRMERTMRWMVCMRIRVNDFFKICQHQILLIYRIYGFHQLLHLFILVLVLIFNIARCCKCQASALYLLQIKNDCFSKTKMKMYDLLLFTPNL